MIISHIAPAALFSARAEMEAGGIVECLWEPGEVEHFNEHRMIDDYRARPDAGTDRYLIGPTYRVEKDGEDSRHMENFVMLEMILAQDMDAVIEQTIKVIAALSGLNAARLQDEIWTLHWMDALDGIRPYLEKPPPKDDRLSPELQIEHQRQKMEFAAVDKWLAAQPIDVASDHPRIVVLRGMPPELTGGTQARGPNRCEIYARMPDGETLELANCPTQNPDNADRKARLSDIPALPFPCIGVGLGVERAILMGRPEIKDIHELTFLNDFGEHAGSVVEGVARSLRRQGLLEVRLDPERQLRLANEHWIYEAIAENPQDAFAIGTCYRDDEPDNEHLAFFTMLEMVKVGSDFDAAVKAAMSCIVDLVGRDLPLEVRYGLKPEYPTESEPRAEIYHGGIELGNVYAHSRDFARRESMGYIEPIPDFPSIDIGIGVERCMMVRQGKTDIRAVDLGGKKFSTTPKVVTRMTLKEIVSRMEAQKFFPMEMA